MATYASKICHMLKHYTELFLYEVLFYISGISCSDAKYLAEKGMGNGLRILKMIKYHTLYYV